MTDRPEPIPAWSFEELGRLRRRRAMMAVSRQVHALESEQLAVQLDASSKRVLYIAVSDHQLRTWLRYFYSDVAADPDGGSAWGNVIAAFVGEFFDLGGYASQMVNSDNSWSLTQEEWIDYMMGVITIDMVRYSNLFEDDDFDPPMMVKLPTPNHRVHGVCRECGDLVVTNDRPGMPAEESIEYVCLSEGWIGEDDYEGTDLLARYVKTRPSDADKFVQWVAKLKPEDGDDWENDEAWSTLLEVIDGAKEVEVDWS